MNNDNKIIAISELMDSQLKNIKDAISSEQAQNSEKQQMPMGMSCAHINLQGEMEFELEYIEDKIQKCRDELKELEREKAWLTSWKTFVWEYIRTWEENMKLMEQIPIADDDGPNSEQ